MTSLATPASGARAAARFADEPVRFERVLLPLELTVVDVLRALRSEPDVFALSGAWAGGGGVVGCRPVSSVGAESDPFAAADALPPLIADVPIPDGCVGGGMFGWFGYRLGARVERLPAGPPRPVALPEFGLAYYDHVLRQDVDGRWWFEALISERRADALEQRREELAGLLADAEAGADAPDGHTPYSPPPPLALSRAAAEHHVAAIAECRERIAAGEIYQANICLRLHCEWDGGAPELFEHALGVIDPPYAALFAAPSGGIVSLSPELFLRREGREVTTAPIKGTIKRDSDPERAEATLKELLASSKDAAEHVMIVDLMRNDIGRVCSYGTVRAPRTPDAEAHPGLWHLVSRVKGELRPDARDSDLLRATFPPGSVTGAPKVQAMHVIAGLERYGREAYTGGMGYVSPVAGLELNVAIRTLELWDGHLWLGAGGGIVADSDPHRELEEALLKARPIAAAVGTSVVVEDAGQPVPIKQAPRPDRPDDRGRPDPSLGVFETLLVRDRMVQALERHLHRHDGSIAELYGARLPGETAERVRALALELQGDHRIRVRAIPRAEGAVVDLAAIEVEVTSEPLSLPPPDRTLTLTPVLIPGGLGPHKWCDRRILDTFDPHSGVSLIVDQHKEVLEAAWANVWIVEGPRIVTPPADGRLLPGVTRAMLLELAPERGLSVAEEPISLERLRNADSIFLTSSLRHAVPAALEGEHPRTCSNQLVREIREALAQA